MRRPEIVAKVRQGLLWQGFGRDYAARATRELEEHWRDLVDEGLRQGLAPSEAEAHASAELGSAPSLVKEFTARMQRSSWLGRHPLLGFTGLALAGIIAWWTIFVLSIGAASGIFTEGEKKAGSSLLSPDFFLASADWIRTTSYLAIPWFICHVARRFHCGWKAALWGCLIVAIHNAMHTFAISGLPGSGTMTWSYGFHFGREPNWLPLLAPLTIFAIDLVWNSRPEPPDRDPSNIGSC